MKKIALIFAITIFSIPQVHAVHQLIFRDASALTTGTINNSLLDNSSITKMGNLTDRFTQIANATASLTSGHRLYDLYAGAPGSPGNIDTIVGGLASFVNMLASAPVNAAGLTRNTSAHATIFFSSGIYDICGATIPQGVEIWANPGSSTVFRPTDNVCRMFTVYGALRNITFDIQGRARAGQMVSIATGGAVTGFTVNNADAGDQLTANQLTSFMVEYATNVIIQGDFNSYAGTSQDNYRGGIATVWHSSNVYINVNAKGGNFSTNGKQSYFITGSRNVSIDGNYLEMGGRFVLSYGGVKDIFIRGKHHITKPYNSYFLLKPGEFGAASTGTYITAHLLHDVASTNVLLDLNDGGAGLELGGVSVTGCTIATTQSTVPTSFVIVRANTTRAIFTDNRIYGMPFISDSGRSTQYVNLLNFVDGIQQ